MHECVYRHVHMQETGGTFREVLTEEMSKEASPLATFLISLKIY